MTKRETCDICGFSLNGAIASSPDEDGVRQAHVTCYEQAEGEQDFPWWHDMYRTIRSQGSVTREQMKWLLAEQDRRTREACVEAVLKKMDLDDCPPASVVIAAIRNMNV